MNQFKHLTGPCLVCKKVKPGAAWGLTPEMAVCDDDWVEKNEQSLKALEAAGKKAGMVGKEGLKAQEPAKAEEE